MNKAHSNINWKNLPSTNTPLNQQNLNAMDAAIDTIDDRVIVHDNEIQELQGYETAAAKSAVQAAQSATSASSSASSASTDATNSENYYKYSKSYAVGGTGIRQGEDTDNSKYYYEQILAHTSGGHAIEDSTGTPYPGRAAIQFVGATVSDDSTNDRTVVEVDVDSALSASSSKPIANSAVNTALGLKADSADLDKTNASLAHVESGTTASQAYTVGSLLVYQGRLCKATSAIAQGDTLAIGTNIAYDTVSSEISQINNDLTDKASKSWILAGVSDKDSVNVPNNANEILLEYIGAKNGSTFHTSSHLTADLLSRYSAKIDYAGSSQIQATANIINRVVSMTSFSVEGSPADSRALFVYYR